MNQASYIPAKTADYKAWLINFASLITAAPATYGISIPNAAIIQGQADDYVAANELGTNPATRTSPTVAAMNAARVLATGIIRPFAQSISKSDAVAVEDKVAVGVNLPNNAPVPVPPPTDVPALILGASQAGQVSLQYRQGSNPTSKAKPFGVIGLEIYRAEGVAFVTDPLAASLVQTVTKSPTIVANAPAVPGAKLSFFARWTTLSGVGGVAYKGPWSLPLHVVAS